MKKESLKIVALVLALMTVLMTAGCVREVIVYEDEPTQAAATQKPVTTSESGATGEPTNVPTSKPTAAPSHYVMGSKAHAGEILNSGSFVFKNDDYKYWTEEIWGRDYGKIWDAKSFTNIKFDEGSAGVHFFATTSFTQLSLVMPTWDQTSGYGCHMYLYLWDTDYDTTLEGTPINQTTVENFSQFGTVFKFTEPMLDGEYLLYVTTYNLGTAEDKIGVWAAPAYAEEIMECYINDELNLDKIYMMSITYTEEPEYKWGPWYQYDTQAPADD